MLGWQVFLEEHHYGKGLPASWKSKADYQLLQPNGLRAERTRVGFGTYPTVTSLSVNLFPGKNLVEGFQAELQGSSLPLQDLLYLL